MHFGFMQFLMLAGSLGLLVFGMKLMSEGLQQAAGSRMRRVLETMTRDRLRGVFTDPIYRAVSTCMAVSDAARVF